MEIGHETDASCEPARGTDLFVLPPPDPNESREPPPLELSAPIAVFLGGLPGTNGEGIASAVLDWRPGALVVAAHAISGH